MKFVHCLRILLLIAPAGGFRLQGSKCRRYANKPFLSGASKVLESPSKGIMRTRSPVCRVKGDDCREGHGGVRPSPFQVIDNLATNENERQGAYRAIGMMERGR